MWYILSKVILVLSIVLLIPTGAVLASQNAVPGDGVYPVKRVLENMIISIASLHPSTRAYFRTDFSKRRFKETMALAKLGKNTTNSLAELVAQTQSAVTDVKGLSSNSDKRRLASDLIKQIDEYNLSLRKIEAERTSKKNAVVSQTSQSTTKNTTSVNNKLTPTTSESEPTPTPIPNSTSDTSSKEDEAYTWALKEIERLREEAARAEMEAAAARENSNNQVADNSTNNNSGDKGGGVEVSGKGGGTTFNPTPTTVLVTTNPTPTTAGSNPTPTVRVTTPVPTCDPSAQMCVANTPEETPTPTGITATTAPTPTPTTSPPRSSIRGYVLGASPVYKGDALAYFKFSALANDDTQQLMKGDMHVIRSDGNEMSNTDCGNGNGTKAPAPNQAWCNISSAPLSGASATFYPTWKPTTQGSYYAVVNIFSNTITNGQRLWCTGNPWCKWGGQTTCAADNTGAKCFSCDSIAPFCGSDSFKSFTY